MSRAERPTYDEKNRLHLIIDALVGSVNYYPVSTVSIYPLIDIIKLLVQQPLIFSFFDENKKLLYCSMEDPQYTEEVHSLLNTIKHSNDLLQLRTDSRASCYIAILIQTFHEKSGEIVFVRAPEKIQKQYKLLFAAMQQERDLADALHRALDTVARQTSRNLSSRNSSMLPDSSIAHYSKLLNHLRSVLDTALGDLAESPLLHNSPDNIRRQLPYPNIFFVVQNATVNRVTKQFDFNYTAQILLSNTQKEHINQWCAGAPERCCSSEKKSHHSCLIRTTEQVVQQLEQPLGKTSRSISDSVFCSGSIEFSPESASQGRDHVAKGERNRQKVEECIYAQIVDGPPKALLIPVHVGGVPWITLYTFTSHNKSDENSSWKHNYHIYRTVTRSIATRLRSGIRDLYLELIAGEIEKDEHYAHGVLAVDLLNTRWQTIAMVYPYEQVEVSIESNLDHQAPNLLKSRHTGTVYSLKLIPNQWYQQQISFAGIHTEEVHLACKRALDRVDTKLDMSNKLFFEQVMQQAHTIKNIMNPVTLCSRNLLDMYADSDMADDLKFINSSVEQLDITLQIALHPEQKTPNRLAACSTLVALLEWFRESDFGRAKIRLTNNLPENMIVPLDDISTAFTILWNLLHNACKAACNEYIDSPPPPVEVELAEYAHHADYAVLSIKNAGAIPDKSIERFLGITIASDQRTWKGLAVIQRKLSDVGWKINSVTSKNDFTEIELLIRNKQEVDK